MGLGGLEPPTSRLSSARSNQLSYKPSTEPHWISTSKARLKAGPKVGQKVDQSFAKKEKRRRQIPLLYARPQS